MPSGLSDAAGAPSGLLGRRWSAEWSVRTPLERRVVCRTTLERRVVCRTPLDAEWSVGRRWSAEWSVRRRWSAEWSVGRRWSAEWSVGRRGRGVVCRTPEARSGILDMPDGLMSRKEGEIEG